MKETDTSIKISVIIPVYNVEKYLKKCLESVINQTLEELEIIVVNDGSEDSSPEIIRAYAEKDTRIRIIDKENTGYGNSMNCGLATAVGEYIGIVESDDFISEKMYETLYGLSLDGTVDVVKGNFYEYYVEEGKRARVVANTDRDIIEDSKEPFTLKENGQISWGHPSVWSGIYRRAFIEENKIRFIEENGGGWVDNPFFYETLCKAKSIMWTKTPLYYYMKSNENSSSNKQMDPKIPFVRMMENLDVLDGEHFYQNLAVRCAYARALMYLQGAVTDFDYDAYEEEITERAKGLMRRLDEDVMSDFNLWDQYIYYSYASPLRHIQAGQKKVLIYNWLPFDNPWNRGGGVTVYCRNLIKEILRANPEVSVYFISSGFAYDASKTEIYVRKINNMFGERVHQYEIVNSPVPAEQRYIFNNPSVALENAGLKEVFRKFIEKYGPFEAVHFNNIEGLSLDVFDLKEAYPNTRFIYSCHNYVPICVTGFYYMRHQHCICGPNHTGEDCIQCMKEGRGGNLVDEMYDRAKFGVEVKKCISKGRWTKAFAFERLNEMAAENEVLKFAETATDKINTYCDSILAVSKRVYDIAKANGIDEKKMHVSYIGTKVAERQIGHSSAKVEDGLKIVFLGSDIDYEEKGYPFLLDALSQMEAKYASQIDLVLTVKQAEHAEIYTMLKNFRSVKVIQGYTHDELPNIFEGCNLSLIPVLWEDNLPQIAIESVAYGVPVLASSAGGASELCDSDLFCFESGNADDMLDKIVYFLERPGELDTYWANHHGLVTMEDHWKEIAVYYGLTAGAGTIEIASGEYSWLLRENSFLRKNVQMFAKGNTVSREEFDKVKTALKKARKENERLRLVGDKLENNKGKVIFQTEYSPEQGDVGANLFKLSVPDFNYSDFFAEIKFVKLENVGASVSDVLNISGTWHKTESGYVLTLHQIDWDKGEDGLKDWIYYYIQDNEVCFFGRYAGRACGYSYEIQTLTSRAEKDEIKFEKLNEGFVWENEIRDEGAFNAL